MLFAVSGFTWEKLDKVRFYKDGYTESKCET